MLMMFLFLISNKDFGRMKKQLKSLIIQRKGLGYFGGETSITLFLTGLLFFKWPPELPSFLRQEEYNSLRIELQTR